MKISDINRVLIDPKMQNKNTNLKIINNNGGRVTNHDLLVAINKLGERITHLENRMDKNDQMWQKQMEFNQKILKRIDNLVSKNNLKE